MSERRRVFLVRPVYWVYNDYTYDPHSERSVPLKAFHTRERTEAYRDELEAAPIDHPEAEFASLTRERNESCEQAFYLYEIVETEWEADP